MLASMVAIWCVPSRHSSSNLSIYNGLSAFYCCHKTTFSTI